MFIMISGALNEGVCAGVSAVDAAAQTTEMIQRLLSHAPRAIRGYTAYLSSSSGKMIRATGLLVCAQDRDGQVHPNAITAAAAVELLHLATLVHDDVIDDAPTRRGKETLQKKFGRKNAVICGDYLFCLAMRLADSIPNKEDYLHLELSDYMGRICLGELTQYANNYNHDLTVLQYLKIIAGKTAALFEASFDAGAVLCEQAYPQRRLYRRLGRYIGMIFQLSDDCTDFEGTEHTAGKPVCSDYRQGVITLPLIHTFAQMQPLKSKAMAGAVDAEQLRDAVCGAGGIAYVRTVSKRYYKKAAQIIQALDAAAPKKQQLTALLDKAMGRI